MDIKYIDRETGEVILERPPGEAYLHFLYNNWLGKLALHGIIKKKWLSSRYGRFMDKPQSSERIERFVAGLGIDMDESLKRVEEFKTFNEFFYRKLKPTARPIRDGIVSPGDGKITAFQSIDKISDFFVKSEQFTLSKFLRNEELAATYADGAMIILRLAPQDYHRYHFPYSGKAHKTVDINGNYMSVSPYALKDNFAQVFTENKRAYTILKTEDKGDIVIAPVGATMVGSIINTYTPDSEVEKGDEMGYFSFGGSTIVLLFEKDTITIDEDLFRNTLNGMETGVKMGMRIGV